MGNIMPTNSKKEYSFNIAVEKKLKELRALASDEIAERYDECLDNLRDGQLPLTKKNFILLCAFKKLRADVAMDKTISICIQERFGDLYPDARIDYVNCSLNTGILKEIYDTHFASLREKINDYAVENKKQELCDNTNSAFITSNNLRQYCKITYDDGKIIDAAEVTEKQKGDLARNDKLKIKDGRVFDDERDITHKNIEQTAKESEQTPQDNRIHILTTSAELTTSEIIKIDKRQQALHKAQQSSILKSVAKLMR